MNRKMRGNRKHFAKGRACRNPKGKRRCWCYECTGNYNTAFDRTQEKREVQKEIQRQLKDCA